MNVNQEQFEAALADFAVKYELDQFVVIYSHGRDVSVRALASPDPASIAGARTIGEEVSKLMEGKMLRAKVNAAMEAADV